MVLTIRETEILKQMLEIFTIELVQERFGEYDFEFEELCKLEEKLLDFVGFTVRY